MKGGKMIFKKKGQAEIITTVLIILLVLAAIVIVWQVVNSTLRGGGEAIESQSNCLDLTVEITNINKAGTGIVTIKPNKDIAGFRVYVNGAKYGENNDAVTVYAFETDTSTGQAGESIATEDVVTTAGLVGSTWCDGKSSMTAE